MTTDSEYSGFIPIKNAVKYFTIVTSVNLTSYSYLFIRS